MRHRRLWLLALFLPLWSFSAVARQDIPDLEGLFERVDPAIVTIQVRVTRTESMREGMRVETGKGTGSGVLVHKDGFVVTAAHVVDVGDEITVEFRDGTVSNAKIVTLSRTEDLALLKLDKVAPKVTPAVLGDSDAVRVGQPVFAIGTPLGLRHTLTAGLVSAVRNEPMSILTPKNVIQTDAALNQGNSGGAVFNAKGEVIGIASFIATVSGGSQGLGFAVPSNLVRKRLFDEPIPYLGVTLRHIPVSVAELFNWPLESALLIERVREGSAAAKAGLKGGSVDVSVWGVPVSIGGDVIVKVAEIETARLDAIGAFLTTLKTGDTLRYTIMRHGLVREIDVLVPELVQVPKLPPLSPPKKKPAVAGGATP